MSSGCDNCSCSTTAGGGGAGGGGGGGLGGGCCPSGPSFTSGSRVTIAAPLPPGNSSSNRAVPGLPPPSGGRRQLKPSTRPSRSSSRGSSAPPSRQRLSLSSRVLILILVAYVASIAIMILAPESQGLLIYCHWAKIPLFRNLQDLISFRIPHGRNIEITTEDGAVLKGWHLLPAHQMAAEAARLHTSGEAWDDFFDDALGKEGARVVIYFHGNAATRGQWNRVELVKILSATLASHVIAVDYRGFGDSTGWPSAEGLAQDAVAVWKWVRDKTGNSITARPGKSSAKVYLYGHSLGSGVAVKLANQLESTGSLGTPSGLILDAPFTNLTSAALHHPSALPFRLLPFIRNALVASMQEGFPSIRLIGDVTVPILFLHGRNDGMIPLHLGQELYQAAKLARLHKAPHLLEDLWFSEFPAAGHNDIYAHPQWVRDMSAFMTTMERPPIAQQPTPLAQMCPEGRAA